MEQTMDLQQREAEAAELSPEVRSRRMFVPRVDIFESGDQVVLLADMPGVDQNSIDITLEKNLLTIHGEANVASHEAYDLAYAEYATGDFQRTFALSDEVDRDRIEATVKNGVLRLTLPKAEQAKARKIEVRTEG